MDQKAKGTSLKVVFRHILRGCEWGDVAITAVSGFPPVPFDEHTGCAITLAERG